MCIRPMPIEDSSLMRTVRTPELTLLKVDDVAAALRCSRGTVYRHVREGDLRALRVWAERPAATSDRLTSRRCYGRRARRGRGRREARPGGVAQRCQQDRRSGAVFGNAP
jgi:hypothetical protein